MKHKTSITILILTMFLLTQFIGLFIINSYYEHTLNPELPYNLQTTAETENSFNLVSIIFSFILAIALLLIITKYKWRFIIKTWFFIVVVLAIGISLTAILKNNFELQTASYVAIVMALPLAYFKIIRPHILVHNLTELLIYPGIAVIFVSLLTPLTVAILLVLISIYDMWMVWKTGMMQKMAKYQIKELNIISGFFIPNISKKMKNKIKQMKTKKSKKKVKVSFAILGGGDIVFPIITSGVFLTAPGYGFVPALFVIFGALAGLTYLLLKSEKKKSYPAMPFITSGIFLAILLFKLIKLI